MMRGIRQVLTVCATVASIGGYSHSSGLSAKAGIARSYRAFCISLARNDMNAASSMLSPGFKTVLGGQTFDRAEFLKVMAPRLGKGSKVYSVVGVVQKVILKTRSAITADTMNIRFHLLDAHGGLGAKGKQHDIRIVEYFKDTWVSQHGAWKMQSSSITQLPQTFIDGKAPVLENPRGK